MTEDAERQLGPDQLGPWLAELAVLLTQQHEPLDATRLVAFAARVVPHGEHCGLTLVQASGRATTLAGSGPLADEVDAIQYATGQGPCLDAADGDDIVRVDDLAVDRQWPEFAAHCVAKTGVRSMFCARLVLPGAQRAALNFYAHRPAAFDDLDVALGAVLAPFAALAVRSILQDQEVGQLQAALDSSRQIGTAIGILMARRQVTREEATRQLIAASQHLNRKVRDVAAEIVFTGSLPEQRPAG